MKTVGYAAHSSDAHMVPFHFERRALRPNDVAIEIEYSGICHSDLHTVNGDWGPQQYPLVPGHEIVGKVLDVGAEVKNYKIGDQVGVGCMVDSCQSCDQCENHEEQYCRNGMTPTYGAPDRVDGEITQGGYSKHIVVREEFVMRIPEALDPSRAAPIMCAGITTYSPLRHLEYWDRQPRRCDWFGWPGPYGGQAGGCHGCRSYRTEPIQQERRRSQIDRCQGRSGLHR